MLRGSLSKSRTKKGLRYAQTRGLRLSQTMAFQSPLAFVARFLL